MKTPELFVVVALFIAVFSWIGYSMNVKYEECEKRGGVYILAGYLGTCLHPGAVIKLQ